MRQQVGTQFIEVLNALRVGVRRVHSEHNSILARRVIEDFMGDFAVVKALIIHLPNK